MSIENIAKMPGELERESFEAMVVIDEHTDDYTFLDDRDNFDEDPGDDRKKIKDFGSPYKLEIKAHREALLAELQYQDSDSISLYLLASDEFAEDDVKDFNAILNAIRQNTQITGLYAELSNAEFNKENEKNFIDVCTTHPSIRMLRWHTNIGHESPSYFWKNLSKNAVIESLSFDAGHLYFQELQVRNEFFNEYPLPLGLAEISIDYTVVESFSSLIPQLVKNAKKLEKLSIHLDNGFKFKEFFSGNYHQIFLEALKINKKILYFSLAYDEKLDLLELGYEKYLSGELRGKKAKLFFESVNVCLERNHLIHEFPSCFSDIIVNFYAENFPALAMPQQPLSLESASFLKAMNETKIDMAKLPDKYIDLLVRLSEIQSGILQKQILSLASSSNDSPGELEKKEQMLQEKLYFVSTNRINVEHEMKLRKGLQFLLQLDQNLYEQFKNSSFKEVHLIKKFCTTAIKLQEYPHESLEFLEKSGVSFCDILHKKICQFNVTPDASEKNSLGFSQYYCIISTNMMRIKFELARRKDIQTQHNYCLRIFDHKGEQSSSSSSSASSQYMTASTASSASTFSLNPQQ